MDFPNGALPLIRDPVVLVELALVLVGLCAGLAMVALNRQRALMKLRADARSFRDLYDNISEGVFRSTLDGRMISANPALVRLNGFDTEAEMLASVNDIAHQWYVDLNRRAELHEILLRQGKVTNFVSEIYRYKTRERIWIEENTRLARDEKTGEPLYYDGTLREVTETVRRLELQQRYEKIASIITGCLYQHRLSPDGTGSMPYASIGLTHIFGVDPADVAEDASMLGALIDPDDLPRIRETLRYSAETLTTWQCEYGVILPNGVEKTIFAHAVPEREADGSTLWHGFLTDVTERKRAEARIYDLAYFDPLTRLPNRSMVLDRLSEAIGSSESSGRWGALLFIDLDQFKILNDTKGHQVGDRLLREVAERLKWHANGGTMVARLGGDEFVILLQGLHGEANIAADQVWRFGKEVMTTFAEPFVLDGFPFQTTASVGVSLFRGADQNVDEILKRADLAMYEAKAAGPGSLRFFQPRMQEVLEERLALGTELREALEHGDLKLVYQTQVDGEGRCFGAEALLRWNHATRGPIPPGAFLPLAESNGLSALVDEFVLNTACQTLRRWQGDPATRGLRLAVNVSAYQLNSERFVATVAEALKESGADPGLLMLELTEHVMLGDVNQVTAVMLRLKRLGVKFALDDFGTGYSSLSYLKRLPIDMLKIDQSFIHDLEDDPSDRVIVQTIVNIARTLEVAVIAEGVENKVQALLLRQLGCHAFQGYHFGRPEPLDAFERSVRAAAEPELRQASA